jgi:hypothetical protein
MRSAMDQWFIIKDNEHQGPYGENDLFEMYQKGELSGKTQIWQTGLKVTMVYDDLRLMPEIPVEPPPPPAVTSPPVVEIAVSPEIEVLTAPEPEIAPEPVPIESPSRSFAFGKWKLLPLAFVVIVIIKVIWQINATFSKPSLMYFKDFERLKNVTQVKGEVAYALALSKDFKTIWIALNNEYRGKLKLKLNSVPHEILTHDKVVMTADGLFADKIASFDKIHFLEGDKIIAGKYQMTLETESALQVPWLLGLFTSSPVVFTIKDHVILGFEAQEQLDAKLAEFFSKSKALDLSFAADIQQKYLTIKVFVTRLQEEFAKLFLDYTTLDASLKIFVKTYTEEIGNFFTSFVIANEKEYTKLSELNFTDSSQTIAEYTELSRLVKNVGVEAMDYLAELENNPTQLEFLDLQAKVQKRFNYLQQKIQKKISEHEEKVN